MALRVPAEDGSVVDLACLLVRPAAAEAIDEAIAQPACDGAPTAVGAAQGREGGSVYGSPFATGSGRDLRPLRP